MTRQQDSRMTKKGAERNPRRVPGQKRPLVSTAKPLSEPGAEILSPFTLSLAHLKRGLLMGGHGRFIIGFKHQGCCQDLEARIITFKKYSLVLYPKDPINFASYFVGNPTVLCVRQCHEKPPEARLVIERGTPPGLGIPSWSPSLRREREQAP